MNRAENKISTRGYFSRNSVLLCRAEALGNAMIKEQD